MRPSSNSLAWVLAWTCSLSTPVRAAPDEVEALVQEGVEARKDHRNEDALKAFQKAYAKAPTARIRAQIALAEQALGDWVAAEKDLDAALADHDDPWIAKHRVVLEEARANIAAHLGWLVLDVTPSLATVTVDGQPASAGTTRVRAGTVVVEVRASGYLTVKRPVLVIGGVYAREKFVLVSATTEPAVVAPHDPNPARPRSLSVQRTLGWSIGGLGVALLGVGTYFGLSAWSLRKDRDAYCDASGCEPRGLEFDRDARTAATRADVTVVGGLVLVGVGLGLVLTGAEARLTAGIGPGGLVLRGSL